MVDCVAAEDFISKRRFPLQQYCNSVQLVCKLEKKKSMQRFRKSG